MFAALIGGDIARVMACIKNGQDVDATSSNGSSAIILAASIGNEEGVRALIDVGADIDLRDHRGKTAAMFAAISNHQGCLRLLVEAGADLNIQCHGGCTALMSAACVNPGLVEYLVAAGSDPDIADRFGYTAAMFALGACNRQGIVNLAMSGANLDIKNSHGFTLLDMASAPSMATAWQNLISGLILSARERADFREHIGAARDVGMDSGSKRL